MYETVNNVSTWWKWPLSQSETSKDETLEFELKLSFIHFIFI